MARSRVKGLERLNRQLRALPDAVKREVSAALEAEAAEMAEAIRRAAPRDTGALAASVGSGPGAPPQGSVLRGGPLSEVAQVKAGDGLLFSVWAGSDDAYWARWVEFGTAGARRGDRMGARNSDVNQSKALGRQSYRTHPGTPAQPFFYPTVRARTRDTKRRVSKAARDAIKALKSV